MLQSNLDSVVLGYPYEHALLLFALSADMSFQLDTVVNYAIGSDKARAANPYSIRSPSDWWISRRESYLRTALDLAVLFDRVHIAPAGMPVAGLHTFIEADEYEFVERMDLMEAVLDAHQADPTYRALLARFGGDARVVDMNVFWHIIDANRFEAPIAVSDDLLEVYSYRLCRESRNAGDRTKAPLEAVRLDKTVDDELGFSFTIRTWDDLMTLRRDGDVHSYRQRLSMYLRANHGTATPDQLRADVREALVKLEEIRAFRRRSRIQTFVSPLVKLVDLIIPGAPLSSTLFSSLAVSRELRIMRREKASRWLLFKLTPLAQKKIRARAGVGV